MPEATLPPQLAGLIASLFGMVMGTYAARAPSHATHVPQRPHG